MFTKFCSKAAEPKTIQYKTKTINDNGIIKTYEWDFEKNRWNQVGSSAIAPDIPVDNSNKRVVEEKPMAFDSLADVYKFLEEEMKKDVEGEKAFEEWKKSAKEKYEAPKCEIVDLNDEPDDPFIDLGLGVLKDRDSEKYILFNSFEDIMIDDSDTILTFNNVDENSATVGITDTQLLTVLLSRLQGTDVEKYITGALKLLTCEKNS